MKEVTFFYVAGCPYCTQARKAIEELRKEDPRFADVVFNEIDEHKDEELAAQYDYWATPAMFIGKEKIYEGKLFETYNSAKQNVRRVMEAAVASE